MITDLPLEAATQDVIARYKRANDMLSSAALAMRRLKERVDDGEAGPEWDWSSYRIVKLEPHVSKRWINQQLALAPPKATPEQVAENVEAHKKNEAKRQRGQRANKKEGGKYVLPTTTDDSAECNEPPPLFPDPPGRPSRDMVTTAKPSPNPPIDELVMEFKALPRRDQDEFLRRIGAVRAGVEVAA